MMHGYKRLPTVKRAILGQSLSAGDLGSSVAYLFIDSFAEVAIKTKALALEKPSVGVRYPAMGLSERSGEVILRNFPCCSRAEQEEIRKAAGSGFGDEKSRIENRIALTTCRNLKFHGHEGTHMVNSIRSSGNEAFFGLADIDTVRDNRGWFIGLGIAFAILGIMAIGLPFAASLVTTLALGWLLVFSGIFQGIHAFRNRRWASFIWAILGALLYIIVGIFIIAYPLVGTLSLTLVLVAFFIAQGILNIIRAIQHRKLPVWGWLLFDGLVSLALGVLIVVGWPGTAIWALGLLVGIHLFISGLSMLFIGLSVGRHPAGQALA